MMPTTLSCPTTVNAINQSARSSEGELFVGVNCTLKKSKKRIVYNILKQSKRGAENNNWNEHKISLILFDIYKIIQVFQRKRQAMYQYH